ncbi:MAG: aspartate aminotransferase family protein [Bacteroidota bacterium]
MLEVSHAKGVHIWDVYGKRYVDMNSGIAVNSLGHCHPEIVQAICDQSERYMHTMVYGEHVQSPQVEFAKLLIYQLRSDLDVLYYLMSGTEATELAMKLAKRYTGRYEIIACRNAYHGSTHGAESLRSDENYKAPYQPLLPGIRHINFNEEKALESITTRTGCVITEVVQGEAGVIPPHPCWLRAVQERCRQVGALFIVDEIQSGFGRTGSLFAHQRFAIEPDVVLVGKAMGGGMPIAGVISSREIMSCIIRNPALGHITTFGGHPMSCAAALAGLRVLLQKEHISQISNKVAYIKSRLQCHPVVKQIRNAGLMMAVEPIGRKYLKHIVGHAFELGLIVDWFLFNNRSFRLAPPLVISMEELAEACDILEAAMDYALAKYER